MKRQQTHVKKRAEKEQYNKKIEKYSNEALQEVRISNRSGSHLNCFRCNVHDSDKHICKMFEIWLEHRRLGIPILTEAIFNNGERADILLPKTREIIEIMCSETEERLNAKNYPFPIRVVKVK